MLHNSVAFPIQKLENIGKREREKERDRERDRERERERERQREMNQTDRSSYYRLLQVKLLLGQVSYYRSSYY